MGLLGFSREVCEKLKKGSPSFYWTGIANFRNHTSGNFLLLVALEKHNGESCRDSLLKVSF